jgi:exodeoxyribonuclease VII small subunit
MVKKKDSIQLEKAFQRLEEIVKQLEIGEESLEKSMELFEEGILLNERCRMKLDEADQKITVLMKNNNTNSKKDQN